MKKFAAFVFSLAAILFVSELKAALNGAYTINSTLPASATNYLNFGSAVSDMVNGTRADGGPINGPTVSGPVVFNVGAQTYNERISIPAITGASAVNTISFVGASPATSIITYNSTTIQDYTIQLNGADFFRFSSLGITNTGPTYGYGIQLISSADDNIISGCNFNLPATSTSLYHAGVIAGAYYSTLGTNASNLTVSNNSFNGGSFGVVANGTSTAYGQNLSISGNTITGTYNSGLYIQYQNLPQVTANAITPRTNYVSSYGAQFRYCNEASILRNKVTAPGLYGFYFLGLNSTSTNYSTIANNMIGGGFQSTGTPYGMYFSNTRYMRVLHNSILVDNPGTTGRGLYITSPVAGIEILNNVISAQPTNGTGAYSVYITTTTGLDLMNNNLYHSNGTVLVYLGAAYNTLAALQAGQPTFNSNSQSGSPAFLSSTDLHTFGPTHSNWGVLTSVVEDYDQQIRPLAPDLTPDVGADEFVLAPIDPDLISLVSPIVGTIGPNTVAVLMQNNGSSSLNGQNITMEYSSDGGLSWLGTQTFVPSTLGTPGSQQTFTFTAPLNLPASGSYNVCVRINPTVPGDPDAVNQICLSICTGLAGVYTINNTLPTGGANYNSFTDAAAAISSCGISGPVTFNVAPGTYNEQVVISTINGASAINTVVFDGANASLVNVNTNSSVLNSATFKLDGADWVTFKNMTLNVQGTYGFCFHLTNQADYNTIENCRLLMNTNTSSVYQIGVLAAGATYSAAGNNANHTVIRNNYISGGYYGVRLNGVSTTSFTTNNQVIGNTIEDYYYYGVYSLNQKAPKFDRNMISLRTVGTVISTNGYGIYSSYADSSFSFSYNVIPTTGTYGIYMSQSNMSNTGRGSIVGNMVGGNFQTTGTAYGLYMTSAKDVDIRHNSFHIGSFTGSAAYILGSSPTTDSIRIVNNIFSAGNRFGGSGIALRIQAASTVNQFDYNLFYGQSANLIEVAGIPFATLAAYRISYPAYNANSREGFPGFRSDSDLHIICSEFDNLGTPLSGVGPDVDNQVRSLTAPDMGADEYTAQLVTTSLGPDTSYCGRLYLTADTTNFYYFAWDGVPSGPTAFFDSSGTHHIVVLDTNNCLARDTINITILTYPGLVYEGDTVAQCSYDSLDVQNAGNSILWSNGDTTSAILPSMPGLYTATITTPDGCVAIDSVTVMFFSDAAAQLGPDTTFCNGGGYLLDAGIAPVGTTYQWNNGSTTQVVLVSAAGTYAVTVSTPQGCVATDSVYLNVLQPPVVNLGPNRYECDQFTLDALNPGYSFLWAMPGGQSASTQSITSTQTGSYSVTVTSPNGCQMTDQVQITVGTTPAVNLGADPVICDGSTATLNAGNPGMTYLWSGGQTTQSITVGTAGTYLVYVTDPVSQCVGIDTIEVIQSNLNVSLGPDILLCTGETAVLDGGPGALGYTWNTGSQNQTITVATAGTYGVSVVDNMGCTASDDIVVTTQSRPVVAFTAPASVPLLQPIQFTDNSTAVNQWFWDFGDGQTSTQQNPSYVYQAMGTFTVCLTASNGSCDSTVCQTVVVGAPVEVEDEFLSSFTKVFPNPGNGLFQVAFDLPTTLDLNLEVYDLAGQRVWASNLKGARNQNEQIDLTNFANGSYYLRIRSSKGHYSITKLVKQ